MGCSSSAEEYEPDEDPGDEDVEWDSETSADRLQNPNGMRMSDADALALLQTNDPAMTRLTDAKNPRGCGHVACGNQSGKQASDEWASQIAAALGANQQLTELHFGSGHHINEAGMKAIATALPSSLSLKKLSLVYGTPGFGAAGTRHLAETLPNNSVLEILDMTSNAIGDEGAAALASALSSTGNQSSLRSIHIGGNGIGPDGAASISMALRQNRTVTTLNLSDNSIGDQGARALADMLSETSSLINMALGNNSIGCDGASSLAEMLTKNSVLQRLSLDSQEMYDRNHPNNISHEGTMALANALATNTSLYFLNLSDAGTTADGVRKIADIMEQSNTTVIKLNTDPNFDPKLDRVLKRNMQTHRASQKLKAKLRRIRSNPSNHV